MAVAASSVGELRRSGRRRMVWRSACWAYFWCVYETADVDTVPAHVAATHRLWSSKPNLMMGWRMTLATSGVPGEEAMLYALPDGTSAAWGAMMATFIFFEVRPTTFGFWVSCLRLSPWQSRKNERMVYPMVSTLGG